MYSDTAKFHAGVNWFNKYFWTINLIAKAMLMRVYMCVIRRILDIKYSVCEINEWFSMWSKIDFS